MVKPEHVGRLSEVLKIPEAKIKSALDASRHIFTSTEKPTPYEAFDGLGHFIEILEHDKRRHVSKGYVLNLAKICTVAESNFFSLRCAFRELCHIARRRFRNASGKR